MIKNKQLIEDFLRYVRIDTQSCEDTEEQPSTAKQRNLAKLLYEELLVLGAEAVYDEEHCYVYAELPGAEPALGFVSHMDTSPAASGENVKPRIIENYDGAEIILNVSAPASSPDADPDAAEAGSAAAGTGVPCEDSETEAPKSLSVSETGDRMHPITLSSADFPELLNHIGEDLIVTDGTTLLGADDKAGVAEIMNLFRYYAAHPELPHRRLCLAFTPDEEVGRGTEHFDTELFGAKEAYTVDGGKLGEIEYECFNGAAAKVEVFGKSVHPGDAKNRMINAASLITEFHAMLPPYEVPEHTEGREGFYFLEELGGSCEYAFAKYIIRDHARLKFEQRKDFIREVISFLNKKYGDGTFRLQMHDQYYNMADLMQDHMELVTRAKNALSDLGIEAHEVPIRGGTDGAALTYMGIPCPNLCTGGYNFHGRFEYASVQEMELSAELLIRLAAV